MPTNKITEVTRRKIFDELILTGYSWHGRMPQADFLSRLYNLDAMHSNDGRYRTASDDINKHTYFNDDWSEDWILNDSRFNLMHCPEEEFLKLLCENVHPVVRTDQNECKKIIDILNKHLTKDNWQIKETSNISGHAIYGFQEIKGVTFQKEHTKRAADNFSSEEMMAQIKRMENAIEDDPELAIGCAKEIIESCCKHILTEENIVFDKNIEIPKLIKTTCETLELIPQNIQNNVKGAETIKRIIQQLAALPHGLAELRNFYGTGHGRGQKSKLSSRHARLAVGASSTVVIFLHDTYENLKLKKASSTKP